MASKIAGTLAAELAPRVPAVRFPRTAVTSLYLPMRDGVRIAVDVLLPSPLPDTEKLPTLMVMTRYWRSFAMWVPQPPGKAPIGPRESSLDFFVPRGFAAVVVDARGTGASFGKSLHPWSPEELADYAEVALWASKQKWSNGRVGAYGISYEGATAQRLAASGGPVEAAVPQEIEHDAYADIVFPGGVLNQAFMSMWSESNDKLDSNRTSSLFPFLARWIIRGVRPVDEDRSWAMLRAAVEEHKANTDVFAAVRGITFRDDPFGSTGVTIDDFSLPALTSDLDRAGVPLLTWGSWMDGASAHAALCNFRTLSSPQIVVIGAWKHEMSASGEPFGGAGGKPEPTLEDQWAIMESFFRDALVEGRRLEGKVVYYCTLNAPGWTRSPSFPPPGTAVTTFHLAPGRELLPNPPPSHGADTHAVDFAATTGTTNRWHTQFARPVAYPSRTREDRKLLCYTSPPLDADMHVAGYPTVTLRMSSTREDGAVHAYLEAVEPSGEVRYVTEGQLRLLHRKLSSPPAYDCADLPSRSYLRRDAMPMVSGEEAEVVIGMQPTSVVFKKGWKVRLAIAGADAGTFARVPDDGEPPVWTVAWGGEGGSCLRLPVSPLA
ncbi:hydrolase CocE/NonD family protein [Hyaloraphidium curvatum]|nr:hydrolase CocE/NonD family protein [Hyaloraphidium curvatum]